MPAQDVQLFKAAVTACNRIKKNLGKFRGAACCGATECLVRRLPVQQYARINVKECGKC